MSAKKLDIETQESTNFDVLSVEREVVRQDWG